MEILHLSDLHIKNKWFNFSNKETEETEEARAIVADIIRIWGKKKEKPLILITGDIVDNGNKEEYEDAWDILKKLKDNFKVMILPGNHDYGTAGNLCNEENFEHFKTNFEEFFEDAKVEFPYIPIFKDIPAFKDVTIIGLNSMQGEMDDETGLWANGQIGEKQLYELKEKLKEIRVDKGYDHKVVLALHHHPFDLEDCDHPVHCLKDGDLLMETIALKRYKVDVLLFGHEHVKETRKGEFGIPLIHMNDKSTNKEGKPSVRTPKHPAYIITVNSGKEPTAEPMIWY